jgi:thioredoxin 1
MKILYFYSKNPGTSVLQKVIVDNIEKDSKGKLEVKRIEFETDGSLFKKYGIKEIPSIIIEKDGKEVTRFSGLTQETFLRRAIERNLI